MAEPTGLRDGAAASSARLPAVYLPAASLSAVPLSVVAAVIVDGDRILACRRRPDKFPGGRWEFPGGKVEPGETPGEALVREIAEELGVGIVVDRELTTDDTVVGDRVIRLTCLRARLTADRPTRSTDHDLLAWLLPGQLPARDWAAPDLPAVRMLTSGEPVS